MSEKRFNLDDESRIYDNGTHMTALDIVMMLNKQQDTIEKQNELINLIADACTFSKEYSVKEILRKEIKGIDTVTYESARAWHDYVILSEFFKEHYKEHWDNE